MNRLYKLLLMIALCCWGMNSYATIYYVGATGGLTSRTKIQARNITTPWARIQTGLDSAAIGDTVWVLPGTYAEVDTVRKRLVLLGNGGTGTRPVIVPPLRAGALSCITVRARDVVIRNFQLEFNQIFCIHGINADGTNVWNGLTVTDCRILSKGTGAPCIVFNSYGIYARGNNDSLTAQRNWIGSPNVNVNCIPGRAIWMNGTRALIGGVTAADSNVLQGYYAIQTATNYGAWRVMNNKLYGIGLLFNSPNKAGATHQITNNQFFSLPGLQLIAQLELRVCTPVGSRVIIKGNTFNNFLGSGIFSGRSRNVIIDSNTFNPASADAICVGLNTKFQTTGRGFNALANSATIINNRFNNLPNNEIGAIAVGIYNHNAVARDTSFKNVIIGGPGNQANQFGRRLRYPIWLDSCSRQSVTYPLWGTYPITDMNAVKISIDASENLFEIGNNDYRRPSQLNESELFTIEGRLKHRTHDSRLGVIRVSPRKSYVSRFSFSEPFSIAPSILRGLSSIVDGDTVLVQPDTLSGEVVNNAVAATIRGRAGRLLIWNGINMNTIGKNLTLASNVKANNSLVLNNGILDIGANTLTLNRGINFFGGSPTSHIRVAGGKFQRLNFLADSIVAPLAVGNNYSRLSIRQGSSIRFDTLTVSLADKATPADYVPAISSLITNHAGLQWMAKNSSQVDNLDATVTVTWPAATEVNGPLNNKTRLYSYNGVGWKRYSSLYINNSTVTTSVTSLGYFAVVADARPFSLATGVNSRFLCSGRDSIDIQALSTDTFPFPNTFTYQLSNSSGSFANPITLGTFDSRLASTQRFPIPAGLSYSPNYRVRVSSSNPLIQGDSSLSTISLDSVPGAPIVTSTPTSICLGDSTILTGPAGYAFYKWSTGETTPRIAVKQSGTYTLTVTNTGRCESPVSQPVTVVVTSFSANPTVTIVSGANTFCFGDSIVLTAPAGFSIYRWSNGANTQQITVRTSGSYNVQVGQIANCLSDTATTPEVVVVTQRPARPFIGQIPGNGNDTLIATAGGQRYEWYYNGVRVAGTNSIFIASRSGQYQVITLRNGCKSDTSDPVTVIISTPRLLSNADVNLYPNPATTSVVLDLSGTEATEASVRIFDAVGRLQRTYDLMTNENKLDGNLSLEGIRPGLYLVETLVNGQRLIKRLTVQ